MPEHGPDHERAYVGAALFKMSADCEHPTLTPACPFSVELRPGVRNCHEQCHDILLAHGLPLPTHADAPKEPPVQRQSGPTVAAAFDASVLYMEDQQRRPSRWSLPSVLWALKQHALHRSIDTVGRTRQEEVDLCLAELVRRGFDADAVVRLGLGTRVSDGLLVGTIMGRLAREHGIEMETGEADLDASAPDISDAWQDLLDAVLRDESADGIAAELPFSTNFDEDHRKAIKTVMEVVHGSFAARVANWVATAPLVDVIAWTAPSQAEFVVPPPAPQPTSAERDRQRWLMDRFTLPYYDAWARESRHLEFLWMRGEEAPPCAVALMDLREQREDELAKVIAVAAVLAPVSPEDHLTSLRFKGLALLRANRRAAAVAIFEAVRELDWELPEPHNNYGFALLPDDPQDALGALVLAHQLGYERTVNAANRALALALLGHDSAVYEVAANVLANYDNEDEDDSVLWDPVAMLTGKPVLVDVSSPRDYVLEVAALVADRAGAIKTAASWRSHVS